MVLHSAVSVQDKYTVMWLESWWPKSGTYTHLMEAKGSFNRHPLHSPFVPAVKDYCLGRASSGHMKTYIFINTCFISGSYLAPNLLPHKEVYMWMVRRGSFQVSLGNRKHRLMPAEGTVSSLCAWAAWQERAHQCVFHAPVSCLCACPRQSVPVTSRGWHLSRQ